MVDSATDTVSTGRTQHKSIAWRWWLLRLVCTMGLLYLGIVGYFWMFQRSIIFSGAQTQGQPRAQMTDLPNVERIQISTTDGQTVWAVFGRAYTQDGKLHPEAASRPTLLFFYGDGGCMKQTWSEFQHLRWQGMNLMIPEYMGYGMSQGQASEVGCYQTADAAFAYLLTRKDVAPNRIIVGGWSLGSSVAVDLASRKPAAGLAIFSSFTSLGEVGQRKFPFLPVRLILRYKFESERKMSLVKCPVFLAHGQSDTDIPFSMSQRLATVAQTSTTLVPVPGAGHNDIFRKGDGGLLFRLSRFADSLP